MRNFCLAALSAALFSCGGESLDATQQTVFATIPEIEGLSLRGDGKLEIICNDGTTELQSATAVWDDSVCRGSGREGLLCTWSDGRGLEPLAVGRARNGVVTLFPEVVFAEVERCQESLRRRLQRGPDTYVCGSRNSEGGGPWTLHHIGAEAAPMDLLFYSTQEACLEATRFSYESSLRVTLCSLVSRDGLPPWKIFELQGTDATAGGEDYPDAPSCYEGVRDAGSGGFLCVSRDDDGVAPYVLAQRRGAELTRYERAVYGSEEECEAASASPVVLGPGAPWLCVSRDQDGERPYALMERSVDASPSMMVYRTLEQCNDAAGQALIETGSALVCASRDEDGFSPWSVYEVSIDTLERSELSFDSVDACVTSMSTVSG